jgi:hypothetical protein
MCTGKAQSPVLATLALAAREDALCELTGKLYCVITLSI